jgi:hypothetical protein
MTSLHASGAAETIHAAIAVADAGQCTKLIRKLRWIGLDDEAARLEQALRHLVPEHQRRPVADAQCTD